MVVECKKRQLVSLFCLESKELENEENVTSNAISKGRYIYGYTLILFVAADEAIP